MNILFLDWDAFGKPYAVSALQSLGHNVFLFSHKDHFERFSSAFETDFFAFAEEHSIDCCFSFNYCSILSESAKKKGLKYFSLVFDSPLSELYSYTIINPNNYVFIFDSQEYNSLLNMGISTVYYTPLPANTEIIHTLLKGDYDKERVSCDVSFVGTLYNEEHNFFSRLDGISDYTRGFLEGIINSQLKIQGYNFIEEILPPSVVEDMSRILKYDNSRFGVETLEYIFAHYVINRHITNIERHNLLSLVAAHAPLTLFTPNIRAAIPNAKNLGPTDYYTEMPLIFHHSKINLNITLRSIRTGIPLRCMDIFGAGGFLLSNYQPDFLLHFIPGEDFVYYEDENDLLKKIDYYLSHEDKRKAIAKNGFHKAEEFYSYKTCFSNMLDVIQTPR